MKIINIDLIAPPIAAQICAQLIAGLPEWFGIPTANQKYIEGALNKTAFAASFENKYVGLVILEFPSKVNANIFWMAVHKDYHGQSIGQQLLVAVEKYCLTHGYQTLTVETLSPTHQDSNYLKTYHFYEKNKFTLLFELRPYGPELQMAYLQKIIAPLPIKTQILAFDEHNVIVDYKPSKADDEYIQEQLFQYETRELLEDVPQHFSIFIKTKEKELLGGALIWIHRESIYILSLWIDEKVRRQGYGNYLLALAEREGIQHGCRYATLDSNYKARSFYEKNGYKVLGEVKNYVQRHSKVFYRKELI